MRLVGLAREERVKAKAAPAVVAHDRHAAPDNETHEHTIADRRRRPRRSVRPRSRSTPTAPARAIPGPGGWGAWLASGDHEKELFGGEPLTTNNRMELTAVIEALASLKRPAT